MASENATLIVAIPLHPEGVAIRYEYVLSSVGIFGAVFINGTDTSDV
jgi:hypothetical protein